MNSLAFKKWIMVVSFFGVLAVSLECLAAGVVVFNVKDYGATGKNPTTRARPFKRPSTPVRQAGGGMVYLPPGEYTSGTIHLRSHVRLSLEAGATLFASQDPKAFDDEPTSSKAALILRRRPRERLDRGARTVNGQAEYEWRPDDIEDVFLREAKRLMLAQGKSILRPFP